jgi:hypothetical protein
VEELLAVSVCQNRRRSGGVGVRVRRTKERRGGSTDTWSCGGGGVGGQQRSGMVEASVDQVNRAPRAVVRYGEEVDGMWAGVGAHGPVVLG